MKTNFLPKLILLSVLSMLIYSCTAEDAVVPQDKPTVILRLGDSISQPSLPNPRG